MTQLFKKLMQRDRRIDTFFWIVILICSIFIIANIKDFGASWDEPMFYRYAEKLPDIYAQGAQGIIFADYDQFYDLKYYGPAYLVLGEFFARGINTIPFLDIYDTWHIINFLTFVMGTYCLYWICQKITGKLPAALAALMYFSQPLLIGHGVMNPKDTPFASFFLLSVALGLKMVDASADREPQRTWSLSEQLLGKWKWLVYAIGTLAALVLIDRIGDNFISHWFIANGSQSFSDLIHAINLAETIFLGLIAAAALLIFFKHTSRFGRSVLLAGIALGLTTSIRILGPAAAALVLLVWIVREKPKKITLPFLAYLLIAVITVYITWPYLWGQPLQRFIESVQVMMNFPWRFEVLFEGQKYAATSMRWFYLTKMMAIQITIPALVLFLFGSGIALYSLYKDRKDGLIVMLPLAWFYIPFIAWVLLRPTTYDNFRQYHFIVPAMFIFVALAIAFLLEKIKSRAAATAVITAFLLPGILSNVYLHPYQYVYYNGLVGWSGNVYERYEGDYWATSTCEAAQYLDSSINDDTRIYLITELMGDLFNRCTQHTPELVYQPSEDPADAPDYAVVLARWGAEQYYYADWEMIHSVSIGDNPLIVIRKAP